MIGLQIYRVPVRYLSTVFQRKHRWGYLCTGSECDTGTYPGKYKFAVTLSYKSCESPTDLYQVHHIERRPISENQDPTGSESSGSVSSTTTLTYRGACVMARYERKMTYFGKSGSDRVKKNSGSVSSTTTLTYRCCGQVCAKRVRDDAA
jgi:hypothetical protein